MILSRTLTVHYNKNGIRKVQRHLILIWIQRLTAQVKFLIKNMGENINH